MNPFTALTSKIFGGLAVLFLVGLSIQTVRIEGIWCANTAPGEKPACIMRGFKQELAVLRIDLDQVRAERDAEAAKHAATKEAYADAQVEAERMESERLARVTAQQEEITDEIRRDYARRLADARTAARRLRGQAGLSGGGSAAGAPAGEPVPGLAATTGRTDETPGGAGFSLDRRLIATEQAIQLDGLITWVEKQRAVDPNR